VWGVPSAFDHVTVDPTLTFSGFGEYAFVPLLEAPLTIETEDPDGLGDGIVGELLLLSLHAVNHSAIPKAMPKIELTRTNIMVRLLRREQGKPLAS